MSVGKKQKKPKPSGFDRNPADFFRGSRGGVHKPFGQQQTFRVRDFTGFRRGSR